MNADIADKLRDAESLLVDIYCGVPYSSLETRILDILLAIKELTMVKGDDRGE